MCIHCVRVSLNPMTGVIIYDCRALRENSMNTDEATLGKQDILLLLLLLKRNISGVVTSEVKRAPVSSRVEVRPRTTASIKAWVWLVQSSQTRS